MDKTAAIKVIKNMTDKVETLQKEASDLRAQLEMYEKRAQAEDILLQARKTNAPDKIKASSIEDFIAKRANLETSDASHLSKIASIVDMYEQNEDGIFVSDASDRNDNPLDFTGNLLNKI